MKALGVGVRVYIGYTPLNMRPEAPDCVACTGVLLEGPLPPRPFLLPSGAIMMMEEKNWVLRRDANGKIYTVIESLLFPIDDDDGKAVPEEKEKELEHV